MSLYKGLVLIHIVSAIMGLGPGFIMTLILKRAGTMQELAFAFKLRGFLHGLIMTGGILLLATGLAMGFLNPYLFRAGWYTVSLSLYLIAFLSGPFLLAPQSKKIKAVLGNYESSRIPDSYGQLARKLYKYEHGINLIFAVIIILMITKPF